MYFVTEYVNGGNLAFHMEKEQFSHRQARYYASEVLLALGFLHANGIVYR